MARLDRGRLKALRSPKPQVAVGFDVTSRCDDLGMSKAHQIVRKGMFLARSVRVSVLERFGCRRLDRDTVRALPVAICSGVE